ncbi:MAG: DMT family transporter [Oceanospirillales bacterium]|nr:MAG: DMT family transporter [Oceanospirillales bacterium]
MLTPSVDWRARSALLLAMAIWGSSFIALKAAVDVMHPMQVIFLRMFIGSIVFLLILPWWKRGFNYQAGDWKWLAAMVLFEPCLYFIFESLALKYTSAGQAGMITSILPLLVAIGAWLLLKERIAKNQWLGFVIALIGVIWMSWGSDVSSHAPNPLLGNSLELIAMLCAVGYTLVVKKLTTRYSPLFLTAIQTLLGTVFFLPLALMMPMPESVSVETFAYIAYLGVFSTLGAYGLYNYALSRTHASKVGAYTNLIPVFTLFFAYIFLNEVLNFQQWLAVMLVFTGVAISQHSRRGRKVLNQIPPGTVQ